jgi:hypothetical protein|tara:strand:+ start:136 stop:702 length:567 start_codon:yes stop_codon:yes gene_type:complete
MQREVQLQVYDDLIPKELQDYFYTCIYGVAYGANDSSVEIFPTVDFKVKYEKTAKDDFGSPISFMHILKSNAELSPHLNNFSLIPQMVCSKINMQLRDILYARIFLTVPYATSLDHHAPHIDLQYRHTVIIYYVNDSGGETVFFDKQGKEIRRVMPKKGRVAVFDGFISHSAGIPTKDTRCIINYNIL